MSSTFRCKFECPALHPYCTHKWRADPLRPTTTSSRQRGEIGSDYYVKGAHRRFASLPEWQRRTDLILFQVPEPAQHLGVPKCRAPDRLKVVAHSTGMQKFWIKWSTMVNSINSIEYRVSSTPTKALTKVLHTKIHVWTKDKKLPYHVGYKCATFFT